MMHDWIDRLLRTYRSIDVHELTEAIAIGIFGVGAIMSYGLATMAYNTSELRYNEELDRQASAMRSHLNFEFAQYGQVLKTAAAFSDLNNQQMSREAWSEYVSRSDIIDDHPAMLGIGYVDIFTQSEKAEYEAALDEEYARPVTLAPEEPRSFYTSISYLEPLNQVNRRAIGFDMYSEPTRRAAMERARDQQIVAMSGPVKLVQDDGARSVYGVLMYYPLYRAGSDSQTPSERQADLAGYVYIVVRPGDVAQQLDRDTVGDRVDFVIRDSSTIVYSSIDDSNSGEIRQVNLDMYGRSWEVSARVDRSLVTYWSGAVLIMLVGVVMSGISAIALYRILSRRITYLEKEHDDSIAATKNELVMLASHQLRTPASGVKQYLGMLTEGLVGELGATERSIITKAYDANERQIETIDQILHVAKADAGQLPLHYKRFDLVALVNQIADEEADDAAKKSITIKVGGSLTLMVSADKRYITMALENLLSNAIKYSYESSTIDVIVQNNHKFAYIDIIDTGVGVDPKDATKLFQKFVRIDNPLSVQEGGTGLGLFLAKEIALAHGGDVHMKSNEPTGSVFTLKIPFKRPSRLKRESSNIVTK